MAFCQKCGAQLNEGSNFCIRCGAPVPGSVAGASPIAPTQAAEPPKSMATTLLLALLLGIMGIWGIGHFYLGKAGAGVAFLVGGFIISIGSINPRVDARPCNLWYRHLLFRAGVAGWLCLPGYRCLQLRQGHGGKIDQRWER